MRCSEDPLERPRQGGGALLERREDRAASVVQHHDGEVGPRLVRADDKCVRVMEERQVADVRDGACSSSTLQEAASWGKVSTAMEQMVFAEATSVLPLLASDAWHRGAWRNREKRSFARLFD